MQSEQPFSVENESSGAAIAGRLEIEESEWRRLHEARRVESLLGKSIVQRLRCELGDLLRWESDATDIETLRGVESLVDEIFGNLFEQIAEDDYANGREALFQRCRSLGVSFRIVLYLHGRYLVILHAELFTLYVKNPLEFEGVFRVVVKLVVFNLEVAARIYETT